MGAVTNLLNSEHSHSIAQFSVPNYNLLESNSSTFHLFTLLSFNSFIRKMVGTLFSLLLFLLYLNSFVYLLSLDGKIFLLNFGLKN